MEKSFDNSSLTIQDADEEGRFKNQLNSTVIDDTSFLHPKIPKRDLKFSPILRPDEDDRRSVYWRRMAVCRSRGESPLAVPYSPLSSKENISRIDDTVATEFSETSTSDDTEKENCSFKTPSRSDSTMEIKRAVNPFHSTLLDSIHMNTFSPSLFAPMKTPENKSISLNIEERAILLPVEISQEDIERSNHYSPDPEFQAKLHASLDVYWQSNVGYVPSPDGPRPIVVDSPCSTVAVPHYASFVSSSPNCRPSVSRRKTVAKRNTKSQTELTIAPSIIFDFKSILGDNCVFDGTDEPEEEFNVSTMNTSLPRKLFSEELSLSSDWTSLEDVNVEEHGRYDAEDVNPVRDHFLDIDLSPIKANS